MIGLVCALASGAAFFLSLGLGAIWPLAWLAPVPVVWYALRARRGSGGFAAAFLAYAIGGLNLLGAYLGVLPPPVLVLAIAGPALLFALAVLCARLVARRLGAFAATLTFASIWAGFDFLLAFDPAGGSVLTPAASQMAMPALIQIASVTGFPGVTFVLGFVAGAIALAVHAKSPVMAVLAVAVFTANIGVGQWRMSAALVDTMRVALIASDEAVGAIRQGDETRARTMLSQYAQEVGALQGRGVDLVVLPENIARLDAAWREAALAPLANAARTTNAMVVVGFNTDIEGSQRNVAWVTQPDGGTALYSKRQLVPVLESTQYTRGAGPVAAPGGVMITICKDLDFPDMIRADVATTRPRLIAAPAWDFGADGWGHARVAILRGVENGVAVARTARDGVMTVSDRYGRMVAQAQSTDGFSEVVADVPLTGRAQPTVYAAIGQLFGWVCLLMGAALSAIAFAVGRKPAPTVAPT